MLNKISLPSSQSAELSRRDFIKALVASGLSLTACKTSSQIKKPDLQPKLNKKPELDLSKFPLKTIYQDGALIPDFFKIIGYDRPFDPNQQQQFFAMIKNYLGESALYTLKEAFIQGEKKLKIKQIINLLQTQITLLDRHIKADEQLLLQLQQSKQGSVSFIAATKVKIINIRHYKARIENFCRDVIQYHDSLSDI